MRRNDVASTSFRRHVPTRSLINQCQIITFLILKSDILENSRIELRGIVLTVPSNQIKVTFIIILPFNLVQLWFFPVSHRNWRKRWVDYWGGQRVCWPPLSNYWRGLAPPGPPSSYAYDYQMVFNYAATIFARKAINYSEVSQHKQFQKFLVGYLKWSFFPLPKQYEKPRWI